MSKDLIINDDFYEKILLDFLLGDVNSIINKFVDINKGAIVNEEWPRWVFIPPDYPNKIIAVAHMDTVWRDELNVRIVNKSGVVYNALVETCSRKEYYELTGIGADDRLGCASIYAALMQGLFNGHGILLTEGEEIVIGSYVTALDNSMWNVMSESMPKFLVELDYPGWGVYTTYNAEPKEFISAIEKSETGLLIRHSPGSFSDIKALGEWHGINSFNMSIGYYRQHQQNEFIILDDWKMMYRKFILLLQSAYHAIPGKDWTK